MAALPSVFPAEWQTRLTDIEPMDQSKWGMQMDGGWFAIWDGVTPVFIKKFKTSERQKSEDEMEIFSNFGADRDGNVAAPITHVLQGQSLIMIQERLAGGDLLDHIKDNFQASGLYTEEEVRQIFLWIANGVKFLHANGVAHRDIKPESTIGGLLSGYVKLIGFGAAKKCDIEPAAENLSTKARRPDGHLLG